jgi:hypothetical protein
MFAYLPPKRVSILTYGFAPEVIRKKQEETLITKILKVGLERFNEIAKQNEIVKQKEKEIFIILNKVLEKYEQISRWNNIVRKMQLNLKNVCRECNHTQLYIDYAPGMEPRQYKIIRTQ